MERVYNFSAGPSMLPLSVLEKAASELANYNASGMSVMEMSHRSRVYDDIFQRVKQSLREVMAIPDTHEVLFMHGGATAQFAAVPLNLIGEGREADYALTGVFSTNAYNEAKKYGAANAVFSGEAEGFRRIPRQDELKLSPSASYLHYCSNNTIYGTAWDYIPNAGGAHVVADMSSEILSRPVDISKYGVIYAGVQKNMAPAGMAVVIIDRALIGKELPITPSIMSYAKTSKADSMLNTPPTYTIYMLGLVLDWVRENGGLCGMDKLRRERSAMLYDFLDNSGLFKPVAEVGSRSMMNVTFRTGSEELDAKFVKEAASAGLVNLKGHRLAGGMRASIYNAMPIKGVKNLVDFMKKFERENGNYVQGKNA